MQTHTNSDYIVVNLPEGTNLTHSIKEDSKWNLQNRSQLVEDLYYACRQNGNLLEELLDELNNILRPKIESPIRKKQILSVAIAAAIGLFIGTLINNSKK